MLEHSSSRARVVVVMLSILAGAAAAAACGSFGATNGSDPGTDTGTPSGDGGVLGDADADVDASNEGHVVIAPVDGGKLVWVLGVPVDADELDVATSAADGKCSAELGRPAFAWVALRGVDPLARNPGAVGPWVDVVSNVVATRATLTTGMLAHGIELDLQGGKKTGEVWTGIGSDGMPGADCNDWKSQTATAIVGVLGATDGGWTNARSVVCGGSRPCLCFEK